MNRDRQVVGLSDQIFLTATQASCRSVGSADRDAARRSRGNFRGSLAPATAINDRAPSWAWGFAAGLGERAWRWDATAGMSDIGALDGGEAAANAVNDDDQIVGSATTASAACGYLTRHAFLSTPSRMQDLATLHGEEYSYAAAINNRGDVVGSSGVGPYRAFLYRNGRMFDLTELAADPDWDLELATGINDAGQITGIGMHHGQQRAFLFERRPEEQQAK